MQFNYGYKAVAQLNSLPHDIQKRIAEKMRFFASQDDPRVFAKRLTGEKAFRFRIGDYRIIADIEHDVMFIHIIERRDKAYD